MSALIVTLTHLELHSGQISFLANSVAAASLRCSSLHLELERIASLAVDLDVDTDYSLLDFGDCDLE